MVYAGVEGVGWSQRLTFVVERHVERLGVGSEFAALQVAPFVAHSAQRFALAVYVHFHIVWQRSFVVCVERYEYEFFLQQAAYSRICPYRCFHFAAVHTTVSREIEHNRFSRGG